MKVGDTVPNFVVPSTSGGNFELASVKGQKVILYFYPKDNTPGCTIESNEFSDLAPKFAKKNAMILGVSRDSLKSHDNFKCKYNFKFELLSDADEALCKLFDVIKEKNMYGKMVLGIERSTFVIDESGVLIKEYRKVKAEGHANQVLGEI